MTNLLKNWILVINPHFLWVVTSYKTTNHGGGPLEHCSYPKVLRIHTWIFGSPCHHLHRVRNRLPALVQRHWRIYKLNPKLALPMSENACIMYNICVIYEPQLCLKHVIRIRIYSFSHHESGKWLYLKGNDPIGETHFWLPWLWEKVYLTWAKCPTWNSMRILPNPVVHIWIKALKKHTDFFRIFNKNTESILCYSCHH